MFDLLFAGRRLTLESPLSADEAAERLRRDLATPEWRIAERRPHAFIGTFAEGRFQMTRHVRGRNSFRPMIDGRLAPAGHGSRVEVRLRLHPVAVVASTLWLVIGTTMLWFAMPIVLADAGARASVGPDAVVLAHVAVCLAPVLIVVAVVMPVIEARKATGLLRQVFTATPSRAATGGA